jgi:acyl dehydratase
VARYFEDVEVGEEFETPGRTITEADVLAYAAISGDHERLDFTRESPTPPPAVPELLVLAITSGLGFRIPVEQPPILAFMVFDLRHLRTVRVGDTIRCRIRVSAKRPMRDGGVIVEQREMVNQRGEVVQESEYKLLVARRPRDPAPPGTPAGAVSSDATA